ncbi:type 1 glutamine amidotransferase [Flavimaricola marinus]|uniref:GMP synthase [glutamine-hydrolyzing] n=1 Tax=Flavimaricola marinus TaxID=1819565 RepID=A0A238LIF0_9RHOB|nr:type 1 glutamine amidotransferase [Flavimaricola marinus]SMY09497.1 GMP synthase [glutamine-hydrolyzing] [Flavimaricola marinus]
MHIGILQTGTSPDAMRPVHGDYSDLFERLLAGRGLTFSTFDVEHMHFPEGPEACEGWLITGSRHGAYEDHPFIAPLEDLIRAIYAANVPLVGICFGHQIIAKALGGKVEKYAGGWAVGPQQYDFAGRPVTLNAWHQDQVTVLPEGAEVCGSNDFCANAALLYGDRAYTVQAHPEHTPEFFVDLAKARRGIVPDAVLDPALARRDTPLDDIYLADQIARFFTERTLA